LGLADPFGRIKVRAIDALAGLRRQVRDKVCLTGGATPESLASAETWVHNAGHLLSLALYAIAFWTLDPNEYVTLCTGSSSSSERSSTKLFGGRFRRDRFSGCAE